MCSNWDISRRYKVLLVRLPSSIIWFQVTKPKKTKKQTLIKSFLMKAYKIYWVINQRFLTYWNEAEWQVILPSRLAESILECPKFLLSESAHSIDFYVPPTYFQSKWGGTCVGTLTITSRRCCCLRHSSLRRVTSPCSGFCTFWSTIRLRGGTGSRCLAAVFQRPPFPCVHLRNWEKREWSPWKFKYFSQVKRSRLNYYWRISPIENIKLNLLHIVEFGTIVHIFF